MNVICYINQFFAGIGGEDKADYLPHLEVGLVGPTIAINEALQGAKVTHTIVCGDNYMGSNTEDAVKTILGFLEGKDFDMFIAGPAFQAGRYGFACGTICKAVKEKFGVTVITSMHVENPGVEMFKKDMPIFIGGKSAAKVKADAKVMASYANKIIAGEETLGAKEEGYYPRGIRHQVWRKDGKTAAKRGVEMLIKYLNDEPFETEFPIPLKDLVPIADPISDLTKAVVAIVTTGGIVPKDNPDKIQSASATRWGRYSMEGQDFLAGGDYKTIHAGFDPAAANAFPDVIVPLDAMRAYEKEGKIAKLHDYFYSTVGTGTTQAEAKRMALEIIPFFREANVNAIIMTST